MIVCEKCKGNGKRLGIGQILIDCKACEGSGQIEKIVAVDNDNEKFTGTIIIDDPNSPAIKAKTKIPDDFDVNEIIEQAKAKYSKSQTKRIAEQKKQRGRKRKTAEKSVFFV